MNRPSPFTYLVGNPLSCLALIAGAAWIVYDWWVQGAVNILVPAFAFLMFSTAVKASSRLASYNQWKRQWDAMGSEPSGQSSARGTWRFFRALVGGALWLGMGYWLHENDHLRGTPNYESVAVGFLATAALIAVGLSYRAIRWGLRRPSAKGAGDYLVSSNLKIPKESPTVPQCMQALPAYCRKLLQPGSK